MSKSPNPNRSLGATAKMAVCSGCVYKVCSVCGCSLLITPNVRAGH